MDLSKNTQIDLLYLTNPNFKVKYNKEISKIVDEEDIKFYRKRILQDTKQQLRGEVINEDIKNVFSQYANELIKHYKLLKPQNPKNEKFPYQLTVPICVIYLPFILFV